MAHKFSLDNPQKLFSILSRPQKKLIVIFFWGRGQIENTFWDWAIFTLNIMNYVFIYLEIYCCLKKLIDLESVVSFLMPRFMKLFWFLVQVLISYVFFCLFFFFTTKKSCLKAWNINQTFSHIFFGYKKSQNPKLCYSLDY